MELNGVSERLLKSNSAFGRAIAEMGEALVQLAAGIEETNSALFCATSPEKCPQDCMGYSKRAAEGGVDDEDVVGASQPAVLGRIEVLKAIAEWLREVDKGEASALWALGEIARIVERELGAEQYELLKAQLVSVATEHLEAAKLLLVIKDVREFLCKSEDVRGDYALYNAVNNRLCNRYAFRTGRSLASDLQELAHEDKAEAPEDEKDSEE